MLEKIEITLPEFPAQKNIVQVKCYMELHDEYFIYESEFSSDEAKDYNDLDLGFNNACYHCYRLVADRKGITTLVKSFDYYYEKWLIKIDIQGSSEDLKIYVDLESQAELLFKKMFDWKYANTLHT